MTIVSSSHCLNIDRSELPFGAMHLDSTSEQMQSTAEVLAHHVKATMNAFPSENKGYEMGLIRQAVACAVCDEDFIDVAPELTKAIFFVLHPRN